MSCTAFQAYSTAFMCQASPGLAQSGRTLEFGFGPLRSHLFGSWGYETHITSVRNLDVWGVLITNTLQGCATNMGSKITLLVYEWPLIKCKIWYINASIFQNFPKFDRKLAQNQENLRNIGWLCSRFGAKLILLVYECITFFWQNVICMGQLSNSGAARPYQNQTWVPPQDV